MVPSLQSLREATVLVHEPKFAHWRSGWHLLDGKNSANNDTLLNIALLGDEKHLVAGLAGRPLPIRSLPIVIRWEAILTRRLRAG